MKRINKEYFTIAGLILKDNNRGTAALGYGSFSFLQERGYINKDDKLLTIRLVNNIFKKVNRTVCHKTLTIQGITYKNDIISISKIEYFLLIKFGFTFPWTSTIKYLKKIKVVAAINGGDGYSDIYGSKCFYDRLPIINIGLAVKAKLIFLPQTLGPFVQEKIKNTALEILRQANFIYVRDDKYTNVLKEQGLDWEMCKDLSFYMKPEPWDIKIDSESIGINISGLCYYNKFRNLSGQFSYYPKLIEQLIIKFQKLNKTIYLIPHSYNYYSSEENNDDLVACREMYNHLTNKKNIILIDKDLTSPQIKYLISKMSFFVGTRMHSNFAAIYTGVPVFGLSYSYKFIGAFNSNGLNGEKQTAMINNIKDTDISFIIEKVLRFYNVKNK